MRLSAFRKISHKEGGVVKMSDIDLVNKVLQDPAFAEELAKNPEEALNEIGIHPTKEVLDALKNLNTKSIVRVVEEFGANLSVIPFGI
jgi:hypothetical protein